MIDNFKIAVGQFRLIKQEVMELDKQKIWPYHLPEVAASDQQILQTGQCLGHLTDPRYRAFLKCANGWPAFYQTVDLFGTDDLTSGSRHETGHFMLSYLDDEVLKKSSVRREDLLPIAATKLDKDLFVLTRPFCKSPGIVIWFAGEEVDRYQNFDEYFLAMFEYTRKELEDFKIDSSQ